MPARPMAQPGTGGSSRITATAEAPTNGLEKPRPTTIPASGATVRNPAWPGQPSGRAALSASQYRRTTTRIVVDRGGGARLDQETTAGTRIGAVGRGVAHDVLFEGDGPAQQFVLGQPHPAHPAAAEERSKAISTSHEAHLRRRRRITGSPRALLQESLHTAHDGAGRCACRRSRRPSFVPVSRHKGCPLTVMTACSDARQG
jgi:hypothetical protein